MENKFWMVLGQNMPVYRHTTKAAAITEAERLAKVHPGQKFVVMESLASVVKKELAWCRHDGSFDELDEVPF